MWKYLLIIDDAVLLVICFDSRKLHHEVHEVRATFLTLLGNTRTHRKIGEIQKDFSKTWIHVTVSQLTSLIISISLKVRRSSQSTFTMWPCRCAFVSWTEQEKTVTKGETGFTDVWNKTKNWERCCSRTDHSMVADVQTAQPIMHKSSAISQTGVLFMHSCQCRCWESKHTFGQEQLAHNSYG